MADTRQPPIHLSHGRIWRIAGPIVLSNATVPILGAVDTGVVGQLGEAVPIGAVGLGAVILSALYWVFGFLRMGTSGLTAQAAGAEDRAEVAALLVRALMIGGAAGLALIGLQSFLFPLAFKVAPGSPEVEALARQYMTIRIWSAPAAIALYGVTGWLIALERTRAVLAIQVVMNGVNIALDLWFVLGLDWGVQGVAIATLLAELGGLVLGLWFCRDLLKSAAARHWPAIFDRAHLWRMAAVNSDILIRSVVLEAIVVSFLFLAAGEGDVTLAANQVLLQFLHVTAFAMDGFAFAAEALVGQAVGARAVSELRRAAVMTSIWGFASGLAMALAFALFGHQVIALMTTSEEVRAAAGSYLPWMVAAPIFGAAAWMLDGIFIGATRTGDMRNMMIISAAIYFAAAFSLVPIMGNHGLWAALLISYVARGLSLGSRYPGLERSVVTAN